MARNVQMEEQMHQDFTPWIEQHAISSEEVISDTGYDPEKYPPQRMDQATYPALIDTGKVSPKEALAELEELYLRMNRFQYQIVRSRLQQFNETKATEDGEQSLPAAVADYLDDGKSVGLISDHADGLFDMAIGQGALNLAISQLKNKSGGQPRGPKHISDFNAWVNKLMTRQFYKVRTMNAETRSVKETNEYIPDLLSVGGRTRWVIPDTDNGRRYISDDSIPKAVNMRALKSFAQDKKAGRGTVEVMVPTGTRMIPKNDDNGRTEYLIAPPIPESSAALLARLDAIVVFSNWSGRVSVSNLIELRFASKQERAAKTPQIAQQIRELMRKKTEEVSGLRVVLSEEIETAA